MLSNVDVILEIQQILVNLPVKIQILHVKAHQDDNFSYEDLDIPAKLNYSMDKYAENQYSLRALRYTQFRYRFPFRYTPISLAHIFGPDTCKV